MWRQWSADIALFLHTAPAPDPEVMEQLAARGITVVEGEVTGIEVTGDRLSGVRLRSGQVVPRRAVIIGPQFEARHALLDSLGVSVAEHPLGIGHQVAADATGRTAAAGVWVAGNAADVTAGVMQAAASGVTAAAAINADLTAEDTTAAVATPAGDAQQRGVGPRAVHVAGHKRAGSKEVLTADWPPLSGRSGRESMSQTEVVCRRSCMAMRTMAALAVIGATSSYETSGVGAT